MRFLRAAFAAFASCAALAFGAPAPAPSDPIAVPKLAARVTDQTGSLTAAEREALESKLAAFERSHGSQVAVLLVPSIGPETIEEFAGRVTDQWQLGRKGVDDGVLVAVAKQERKIRIQTGRGVQGTLTDALSKRIAADTIAPRFRTGDFAGGLNDGVDAIFKAIEGESLPLPAARSAPHTGKVDSISSLGGFLIPGIFIALIAGGILRAVLGRFVGAGATGALVGGLAWFFVGSIAIVALAAIAAFIFTLISGLGSRGGFVPGGFGGGGLGGGGFGGGGFSGGGGSSSGGFSGGGGSFDGGGASGDW